MKYGIGLIQDLVEEDPDKDLEQLMALSATIAIKLQLGGLDGKKRKRFATIFRKIASKIETEAVVNVSLWGAFWGKSPDVKGHVDINV